MYKLKNGYPADVLYGIGSVVKLLADMTQPQLKVLHEQGYGFVDFEEKTESVVAKADVEPKKK